MLREQTDNRAYAMAALYMWVKQLIGDKQTRDECIRDANVQNSDAIAESIMAECMNENALDNM